MIIFVNLFWICSSLMVPSIPTNYIKPKKPFSTTIFGKNLVFWKKNNTVTSQGVLEIIDSHPSLDYLNLLNNKKSSF